MKDSKLKRILVGCYEIFYEARRVAELRVFYHLNIMSYKKTIKYIQKKKCCVARYGNGEFDQIFNKKELFQETSEMLSKKLAETLENKNKNLLLCLPRCLNTLKGCNDHSRDFWITWGKKDDYHKQIVDMIRSHAGRRYIFGDSLFTRPYIDWKTSKRAEITFPMLKSIWEGKDVLIVEGDETRLGVGNNLFDGAKSIKRILVPALNAFNKYDDIKETVLENYSDELIIMAIGPTATILASEFADMNIQALDIGHIDIEYEWYLRGAKERIAIPGKFTNETIDDSGRSSISECNNEKYLGEIIARIK